jgi:hypothetical protein
MAFLLYTEDGSGRWRQVQAIKLLPSIADFVASVWKPRKTVLSWHMSESALTSRASRLHGLPNQKYFVVIDLKPTADRNVSLYRIQNVWGVTTKTWTPLALRLQGLYVDRDTANPSRFKTSFRPPNEAQRQNQIHEFLYCGHSNGISDKWRWGRSGAVNGALLWPDAFNYLVDSIRQTK